MCTISVYNFAPCKAKWGGHCDRPTRNKAVNLKAKPLTRPDSQPTDLRRAWVSRRAPSGTDELGKGALPAGAPGLSNHSHHMPPGGVREQGERRRRGAEEVHLLPNTNPSLSTCPGGLLTTRTHAREHAHVNTRTSPVIQDHRNSICPALISTKP